MVNIALIFTTHRQRGKCNIEELYKIIQAVNPEVIFEELSESNFRKYYQEEDLITLETSAIKKYLSDYPVAHIPVDTFTLPPYYEEQRDEMYNKMFGNRMLSDTRSLQNTVNDQEILGARDGFSYLNSSYNDELFEQMSLLKDRILAQLNQERLFKVNQLDQEVIAKREDVMLENIYQYTQKNSFSKALFFIGSGHRQSMLEKIAKSIEPQEKKVNWNLYDSLNL